ncbi:replication factor C large subunit [archaeon]|jgi:replication factor C large subunit|nr:replication factor C large subunit [archaeon]MBT3720943.1 replication factor C large subunit [archaeon]MBT4022759.1 replication factor C large subunit [archaeon]MBT4273047.1 replication factor C large subunit [archaeon]MBT4461028.1 replication factor C large subunit [archaeon]
MQPWTTKYLPKNTNGIQGQNKAVESLKLFLDNFPKQRAALLYGPPGCGKTSLAHAVAKERDLELIEVNASDVRNAESIKQKLGPAMFQMSLFSKGKIILVDEIDGVSGNKDRGGLSALRKLNEKTQFPVIMTANNPFDKKFSALRKKSEIIQFQTLNYLSVQNVLKRIAKSEGVEYDEIALSSLARRAGGDLRGAINDLQTLSEYNKKLSKEDVDELSGRRQKDTMINALMRIFKTTNPDVALPALDDVDEDINDVFLWIEENLPKEYKKPKDIARAFDNLSLADVFRGRIRKRQHWRFLVYINNLLTAGIALSKDEKYPGFNKYTRTTRILRMWQWNMKTAKRKAIVSKIAAKTHTSSKRVLQDTFPYVKSIFKNNKEEAEKLANYFELDKEEVAYLSV